MQKRPSLRRSRWLAWILAAMLTTNGALAQDVLQDLETYSLPGPPPGTGLVGLNDLVVSDLDGDGVQDLILNVRGVQLPVSSHRVYVARGLGVASFDAPVPLHPSIPEQLELGALFPFAVGDVDEDGALDVMHTFVATDDVVLVLGQGDGTFTSVTPVAVGGVADVLHLMDVDTDGHLDMVFALVGQNRVRVRLGAGDGSFGPVIQSVAMPGIQRIVMGDLDDDGLVDLVVGAGEPLVFTFPGPGGNVMFLGGRGDGSFDPPVVIGPVGPSDIAVGDVTGDAVDDLVITQSTGWSLLAGVPGAAPAAAQFFPTDFSLNRVRLVDIDTDGDLDGVIGAQATRQVFVLRNETGTGLGAPRAFGALAAPAFPPVVADVDNDGRNDLLFNGVDLSILLGQADGGFRPAWGVPDDPRGVAIGDLDGDGFTDLVVLGDEGGPGYVMLGRPGGEMGSPLPVDLGPEPVNVFVRDVTDDGRADLVTIQGGNFGGGVLDGIVVAPGQGDGTFGAIVTTPVEFDVRLGVVEDVNGDGLPDVLLGIRDLPSTWEVHVMLGQGDGSFLFRQARPLPDSPQSIVVGDLDGDPLPDLAVTTASNSINPNGDLSLFVGVPGAPFSAPVVVDAQVDFPLGMDLGDVTGDGLLDAVIVDARAEPSQVVVFPGVGDGTVAAPLVQQVAFEPTMVRLADLDRDGVLDLVTTSVIGATTVLRGMLFLPGLGGGQFGSPEVHPNWTLDVLELGDLDGDGALDVVVAPDEQFHVKSYLNTRGPWRDLGFSLAGDAGFSKLLPVGTLEPDSALQLRISGAPALAPTSLVVGVVSLLAPFKGGVLVPDPLLIVAGLSTDGDGALVLPSTWPTGLGPGVTLLIQAWFVDAGAPAGLSSTNGISGTSP